jgi:hypothetical protein
LCPRFLHWIYAVQAASVTPIPLNSSTKIIVQTG